MRTQFIKYTPPEMPQLLFTLRVEREPYGDYYIQGGNVQAQPATDLSIANALP